MRTLFATIAALGMTACLPPPPSAHGPTAGDDPGGPTQGPTGPTGPTTPSMPANPVACGNQTFSITTSLVPPNVFLLVDRSGSMSDDFGGAANGTKWDAAQTALNALLTGSAGKASWGLSLFPPNPSADTCGKAAIDVPLTMGDESTILTKINGLTNNMLSNPRGSTPTADALKTVRDSANLAASDRNNYVVLVTDGIPACNNPADVGPVIDDLYNRAPAVKTFVVGIGSDTASNPTLLNQWAEKGHTARPAPATSEYYQANDAAGLMTAFDAIIGAAGSCTYKLMTPPADPTLVVGQLDGMALASDPVNGFTYDMNSNSVIFHGTACDKITSGAVKNVNVEYGCPATQIL
jgi:hypothetical protein